jgi:hypothetical protein
VSVQTNKIISSILPIQSLKDESTISQDTNHCKTKSKSFPLVYEVEMPQALTESDSSKTFDILLQKLSQFSAEGIQILLKFPHE